MAFGTADHCAKRKEARSDLYSHDRLGSQKAQCDQAGGRRLCRGADSSDDVSSERCSWGLRKGRLPTLLLRSRMLLSWRMAGPECAAVAEPVGNSGRVAVLRLTPREAHSRLAFRHGRHGRRPSHYQRWSVVSSAEHIVAAEAMLEVTTLIFLARHLWQAPRRMVDLSALR